MVRSQNGGMGPKRIGPYEGRGRREERRESAERSEKSETSTIKIYCTRSAGTEEIIMELFGFQRGGMVQEGFGAAE